jgi:NADH:ubiquinone oxidoreductase subunit
MFQSQLAFPSTFEELADSLFAQLPNVPRVDYVTNAYFQNSIKSIERIRRGTSAIHLIKGSATKVPRDWKAFLSNYENKSIFVRFLQDE